MAFTVTVTVTVIRENFHWTLPYKIKILIDDFANSLSVNVSQQAANKLQNDYGTCAESKVQWNFQRVTVIVTVKVTVLNSQTPIEYSPNLRSMKGLVPGLHHKIYVYMACTYTLTHTQTLADWRLRFNIVWIPTICSMSCGLSSIYKVMVMARAA